MTTATKSPPKPKTARERFAESIAAVMADYDTMPDADRYHIDRAIIEHMDVVPKDWAMAMRSLAEKVSK
jgi:hypothetical protein